MGIEGWHRSLWASSHWYDYYILPSFQNVLSKKTYGWQYLGGRFGTLFDDDPKKWRMYADFIGSAGRLTLILVKQ